MPPVLNKPNAAISLPLTAPLPLRMLWPGILILAFSLLLCTAGRQPDDSSGMPADAPESPEWQPEAWFTGVYQEKEEKYLKEHSRIAKGLIPYKNQIDYDLFRKLNLAEYLIGKKNQLLGVGGLEAYYGRDYIGDSAAAERMRQVRVLQDTLHRKGIDLVLLFVPTKEQLYPEYIPDAYRRYTRKKTNLDAYNSACRKLGINHIDFLPFFQALKSTSRYPLYPQYGSHWSYYSECLVVDTVIKYIERMKGVPMYHISWEQIEYPMPPKVRDADAINKCGLLTPPKGTGMAYPQVRYQGVAGAQRIKTLGIGDSYYRGFAYLDAMEIPFDTGEFWYYYNTIVPESMPPHEVWEYDLKTKIEENKVILLLSNNAALSHIGHGFIEDAYELYTSPKTYYARAARERRFRQARKEIRMSPDLLDEALALANARGIGLDSAIDLQARQHQQAGTKPE